MIISSKYELLPLYWYVKKFSNLFYTKSEQHIIYIYLYIFFYKNVLHEDSEIMVISFCNLINGTPHPKKNPT